MSNKPLYPDFKEVKIEDKPLIESLTSKFLPYCDFNFANILNWSSSKRPTTFSILNSNLVITQKDFTTENILVSYIGNNQILETVDILIRDFNKLTMVPLESLDDALLKSEKYLVEEDANNSDYVLCTQEIAELKGNKYKSKRRWSQLFEKLYPDTTFSFFDHDDKENQKRILEVDNKWASLKKLEHSDEKEAIERLLEYSSHYNLRIVGIFDKDKLIGFTTNELVRPGWAIGSFGKADYSYKGAFAYLEHKTSVLLQEIGVDYLNYEQDLGLEGLRETKHAWRPCRVLPKYKISIK